MHHGINKYNKYLLIVNNNGHVWRARSAAAEASKRRVLIAAWDHPGLPVRKCRRSGVTPKASATLQPFLDPDRVAARRLAVAEARDPAQAAALRDAQRLAREYASWSATARTGLAARGERLASHRDGRGAPPARRDDRAYGEYVSEEQRRRRGCIARRMQPDFHHGLLEQALGEPLDSLKGRGGVPEDAEAPPVMLG